MDSIDWLGVPLKIGEHVIGVMVVKSYSEKVKFGQKEEEVLECVSTQVTTAIEYRMAQQRIADALTFNKMLLSASKLGISAYDYSGECILANEAITRIIGTTPEQVLKKNINQIEPWKELGD